MTLFKEYRKTSLKDPRQTFEASVSDKLKSFDSIDENANEQERNEYLLDVIPFIKSYYTQEELSDSNEEEKSPKSTGTTDIEEESKPFSFFQTSKSKQVSKGNIYKNYMRALEGQYEYSDLVNGDHMCEQCNKKSLIDVEQAQFVCQFCGLCKPVIETYGSVKQTPSMSEQNEFTPHYCYKRSNHFSEWLNQLQAKETTHIPDDVYDKIRIELKKERINEDNLHEITHKKIRMYLKKHRLNKYYEHIPHIITSLKGESPQVIDPETELLLRHMFEMIQEPFRKHCPKNRKNFLSYSYTLYKMCEILGQDQLLKSFPLLKSREKLATQDVIWKGICKELEWQYIPSI